MLEACAHGDVAAASRAADGADAAERDRAAETALPVALRTRECSAAAPACAAHECVAALQGSSDGDVSWLLLLDSLLAGGEMRVPSAAPRVVTAMHIAATLLAHGRSADLLRLADGWQRGEAAEDGGGDDAPARLAADAASCCCKLLAAAAALQGDCTRGAAPARKSSGAGPGRADSGADASTAPAAQAELHDFLRSLRAALLRHLPATHSMRVLPEARPSAGTGSASHTDLLEHHASLEPVTAMTALLTAAARMQRSSDEGGGAGYAPLSDAQHAMTLCSLLAAAMQVRSVERCSGGCESEVGRPTRCGAEPASHAETRAAV